MRLARIFFAALGTVAALFALATVTMAVIFYTPMASPRALWLSTLYAGIAAASFYAFFRLKADPGK